MSRKLFALLVREIEAVRLVCRRRGCGGVNELPLAKLVEPHVHALKCPACGAGYIDPAATHNPLLLLSKAAELLAPNADLDVEFVVTIAD